MMLNFQPLRILNSFKQQAQRLPVVITCPPSKDFNYIEVMIPDRNAWTGMKTPVLNIMTIVAFFSRSFFSATDMVRELCNNIPGPSVVWFQDTAT